MSQVPLCLLCNLSLATNYRSKNLCEHILGGQPGVEDTMTVTKGSLGNSSLG